MLWCAITAHVTEQCHQKWSKQKRPGQLFFVVRIQAEAVCTDRCGAGRHKVHLAKVVAEGAVPVDWRTLCAC